MREPLGWIAVGISLGAWGDVLADIVRGRRLFYRRGTRRSHRRERRGRHVGRHTDS